MIQERWREGASLLFCLACFGAGKLWYRQAETESLLWLLQPSTTLLSWLSGMSYAYLPHEGYLREDRAFLVHKDCSGFNFFLLALLVAFTIFLPRIRSLGALGKALFACTLASYLVTLLANTSRLLLTTLFLLPTTTTTTLALSPNTATTTLALPPVTTSILSPLVLHKGIGITVYLFFLILFSLLLWSIRNDRKQPH